VVDDDGVRAPVGRALERLFHAVRAEGDTLDAPALGADLEAVRAGVEVGEISRPELVVESLAELGESHA